ncbi:WD40-repeat-containing domain protein [Hygrophoropsis aurantiaca]|uniref:WD40-repeat-containing domain protein n=1 Tax=Hygrophoropsis aurantiaca TaxID=72124 RepID=A0ACB8A394_9AGAM|nr:WD40-repeat-containing domain protein [Hygrophoropsis aurantiaca]
MYRGNGPNVAAQFNDFGAGESAAPPRSDPPRLDTRRKQTLLSLLNALNELSQSDTLGRDFTQNPSFEDDRDVPTVDEQLQVAGAEAFNRFQKRINNLDKELRNFANAARQLGSSVGILSSAFRLRERLAKILFLFRENAADLFPRKCQRQPRETLVNPNLMDRRRKAVRRQKSSPGRVRPVVDDSLDAECFPEQFESFACDVMTFLNCLNEFPEFTDEAVNSSIKSLEGDLKYWACCLRTYRGQFKYPAVQRYIHDLTAEMGEHIDTITGTLSMFIEVGVPTIRFAQKHGASNLLNLSTVATFFSAVTATTLQFSYSQTGNTLSDAVNAFWFSSLVFSIAAAVNSLLGLSWKQAMYRSPGHRVPWWVLIWIKRSPLVFLVISVACFSAGLVLFTYSTNQGKLTSTITTVFTAFTSFGLAAVSAWFASEKWIYIEHRGQKWLSDVLTDSLARFLSLRLVAICWRGLTWGHRRMQAAGHSLKRVPSLTTSFLTSGTEKEETVTTESILPMSRTPEPLSSIRQSTDTSFTEQPLSPTSPASDGSVTPTGSTTFSPRDRLTHAIRSVMMLQSASAPTGPFSPKRKRTTSSALTPGSDITPGVDPVMTIRGSRVATLVPKLKSLQITQDLAAHSALVRHLQFSPNGKFLATSSWDKTSIIFRVGDPCLPHRVLAHPAGFVGQVAWSPTGALLLTRLNRAIKVWTEEGVCRKTIERPHNVQSVTWLPGGEALMSVEGSEVVKLDLNGRVLDKYEFNRVLIHDVAITPDSQRLLGVGPILASPSGLQPSKSRVEKQLLIYNVETKLIENQTPVLNDVRDITLARNGQVALISYENKAPPQLWKLEMVKSSHTSTASTARLTLRHTYMPKMPVDFAGPSYFGGKDDQLVLCAGKAGDIHIWDRESAALLHHVRAQAIGGGDLTCIAWNHAAEKPFMFATGSHDGAVSIWTTPSYDLQQPGESSSRMLTAQSTPRSLTPRSPSPMDFGSRTCTESPDSQHEHAMYTSQPFLTLSPSEENGPRDRTVTFAPPGSYT